MRVLLIMGHPRRNSFCAALAGAYKKRADEIGITVRELTLPDLDFNPDVTHEDILEQTLEPDLREAREAIGWAQHLVFIYPIWWGMMPALLKGFLDRILLPGFAFAEREEKGGYVGLLKGKSAQVITTMDTPPWVVKFILRSPGHRAFSLATLRFCGIRPVRVRMFGPVKTSTPATRRKWLKLAAEEAERVRSGKLRGIEAARDRLAVWLKALRLQFYPMTWVAYTAGASWLIPLPQLFSSAAFWWGYALLFFIEVMTVFLNEIHDYESDHANASYGPFNGGSRVLVDGLLTFAQLKRGAAVAGAGAFVSLLFLLSHSPAPFPAVLGLAFVALVLGVAYTVPPAKLCHRGAGETVVAFTHSVMIVQCGVLFLGGPLAMAPVWIIGVPLFFAVFAAITLSGIPDRVADQAAGKLTLAVRFGTGAAYLTAIVTATAAILSVLILQIADRPGEWPVFAVCGMVLHGLLLISCLEKKRRAQQRTHIDGLMVLALSFILWFAVTPLFARPDRAPEPIPDHAAGRTEPGPMTTPHSSSVSSG